MKKEEVLQWLQEVQHPGRGEADIVALGMVQDIGLEEGRVRVTLAFLDLAQKLAASVEG